MIVRTETTDSETGEVTVEEVEVPDPPPDPIIEALAAVDAAEDFDELKASTHAFLSLLAP